MTRDASRAARRQTALPDGVHPAGDGADEPVTTVGATGDRYITMVVERYPSGTPGTRRRARRGGRSRGNVQKAAELDAATTAQKLADRAADSGKRYFQSSSPQPARSTAFRPTKSWRPASSRCLNSTSDGGRRRSLERNAAQPAGAATGARSRPSPEKVFEIKAGEVATALKARQSRSPTCSAWRRKSEPTRSSAASTSAPIAGWLGQRPLYADRAQRLQSAVPVGQCRTRPAWSGCGRRMEGKGGEA